MATTTRLTVDDLDLIPEERAGDRHELIDGELIVTPVPILKHQMISGRLFRYLDRNVEEQGGMVFSAPTGVRFAPDTLIIPDLFVVLSGRLPAPNAHTFDEAPDLVIEILSPGTRRRDLTTKRDLYARFGVPEYWIVDPDVKSVTLLALQDGRYEQIPIGNDGSITSRVLPGLALTLARVFLDI